MARRVDIWSATADFEFGERALRPAALAFVLVALTACSNGTSSQVVPPIDLGMTSQLGAYFGSQNLVLYQVQAPVQFPIRKPSGAELRALGAAPKGTPYPRTPFVLAGDETVEVRYTISNLDQHDTVVWLLVDPWNEFVRYNPGVQIVSDEETIPNFGYDLPFVVPGRSRVSGTITSDDVTEIAIKLASVMNLLASPQAQPGMSNMGPFDATLIANNIFNPQNRSNSNDPLYTPWIPTIIAGLTGFDLGLRYRCSNQCQPPNVAIEIVIDVQTLKSDLFVDSADTAGQIGKPTTVLSPPAAR
jgi:hypothetical protein